MVKISWWKLDNNFYEVCGVMWVLLYFLKVVEIEFVDVFEDKNVLVSF